MLPEGELIFPVLRGFSLLAACFGDHVILLRTCLAGKKAEAPQDYVFFHELKRGLKGKQKQTWKLNNTPSRSNLFSNMKRFWFLAAGV
jgi:hypothetical protein